MPLKTCIAAISRFTVALRQIYKARRWTTMQRNARVSRDNRSAEMGWPTGIYFIASVRI
jgi:hypothetical protein